jgi:hypothetical protein
VVVALSATSGTQGVQLRTIDGQDSGQTVDQLVQLVDDNTR